MKKGLLILILNCFVALGFCQKVLTHDSFIGQKLIYVESDNGLHCLSLENGREIWYFAAISGDTPAVDQNQGFVYYQSNTRFWKLDARTGVQLDYVAVPSPAKATCTNTILIDDAHGYFLATIWSEQAMAYSGTIRVYDSDLDTVWTITGLNTNWKATISYNDGLLFVGTGETFAYSYNWDWYGGELEDCRVIAYNIADGSVEWTFEVDDTASYQLGGRGIMNVIYCNGYLIAETQGGGTAPVQLYEIYVLDASDGSLLKTYNTWAAKTSSCGVPCFSYGRLFSGDIISGDAIVTQLGTGTKDDWESAFGDPKINPMSAPATALATLDVTPTHVGQVAGAKQGGMVKDGIAYFTDGLAVNGGVIAFDVETLSVIRKYDSEQNWDSSPLVTERKNGDLVLLIKESVTSRVIAYKVDDGTLLWTSDNNMPGTVFFGFSYYDNP